MTAADQVPAAATRDTQAERTPGRLPVPAEGYTGFAAMLRLVLRRNRVRLGVWVVALAGTYQYIVSYYRSVFPDQQSLDDFAALSDTPGIKALTGLSPAASTMGGAVWTKGWMTVVLALAMGVVFLVTRSGRADEEAGRTELLRSRVLGIHAYSIAAWLVTGALCVVVGVLITIVSIGGSLDPAGTGVTGSLILGASVVGVGLVGVGVGAVAGQLSSTARGANSLGSGIIVGLYVLRMIGDMGNAALTWLSPIGWGAQMQPYAGNRWWPFLLLLVLTTVLLVGASQLEARRDFGAGLLPQRPGKAQAPARYATPLGLALRMQRNPIIGWTAAVVLGEALMGSVVEAMTDLLADAGAGAESLLRGTGVTALLALLVSMMAFDHHRLRAADHGLPEIRRGVRHHRTATRRRALPPALDPGTAGHPGGVVGGVVGPRRVRHRRGVRRFHPRLRPGRAAGAGGIGVLACGHGVRRARRPALGVRAAGGDSDRVGRDGRDMVRHHVR